MLKRVIAAGAAFAFLSANAWAQTASSSYSPAGGGYQQQCGISNNIVANVQGQLKTVIQLSDANGGLFKPNNMWSAIVDRKGVLCSVINTIGDPGTPPQDPWPGSRSIAIAKASTANDFSNNKLAISTANLYGVTQPGGSLWGLNESNPFNPQFQPQGTGVGYVPGGIITFGGGVALYYNGQVIGGLGVSGDTSCADHTIAYRMRRLAGLQPTVGGPGFNGTDNILYAPTNICLPATPGSTTPNIATCPGAISNTFMHPHCTAGDIAAGNI